MGGFIVSLFLKLSVVWYYLCLHTEGKTQLKKGHGFTKHEGDRLIFK